jgi:hypothetical protein
MTAIQAAFVKLIQVPTRSAYQLVMEVPEEAIDHVLAVLGGAPKTGKDQWVGIAPLRGERDDGKGFDGAASDNYDSSGETAGAGMGDLGHGNASEDRRSPRRELTEGERLRTRAVLLCRDERFQRWMLPSMYVDGSHKNEEYVAEILRNECGIDSRSELALSIPAQAKFRELLDRYLRETGQAAERRGG